MHIFVHIYIYVICKNRHVYMHVYFKLAGKKAPLSIILSL